MTNSIGSSQNVALQPAATRPVDEGQEATRRALDQQELEGREAVHEAPASSEAESSRGDGAKDRPRRVDRYV